MVKFTTIHQVKNFTMENQKDRVEKNEKKVCTGVRLSSMKKGAFQ